MKKDKEVYDKVCEYLSPHLNKDMEVLELACWFRVITVIEANSYVNIRSSRLLPKFKTLSSFLYSKLGGKNGKDKRSHLKQFMAK